GTYSELSMDEFKAAGLTFAAKWRYSHLDRTVGNWNGTLFWKLLDQDFENPDVMRKAYEKAVALNQGTLEDQITGYWTAVTLQAQHIQEFGPHPKRGNDREILIRSLRALISLSVTWKALHPAPRNRRDQRFLFFVEHTLARSLDPTLYDERFGTDRWKQIYHNIKLHIPSPLIKRNPYPQAA